MQYYDKEYRTQLLSFLNGYKNILLYLKENNEGIGEVLIEDNLKKLEEHIRIVTPTRFELLNDKIKKEKKQQAEEFYNAQLEELKNNSPKQEEIQQVKSETEAEVQQDNKQSDDKLFQLLQKLEQRLEALEKAVSENKKSTEEKEQVAEENEENSHDAEFDAQLGDLSEIL